MTEPSAEGPGFVGIRFCQECNNMLYPKEDKVYMSAHHLEEMLEIVRHYETSISHVQDNRVLLYACRNCDYRQLADSCCVYVNKIMHEVQIFADCGRHLSHLVKFCLFPNGKFSSPNFLGNRNIALCMNQN